MKALIYFVSFIGIIFSTKACFKENEPKDSVPPYTELEYYPFTGMMNTQWSPDGKSIYFMYSGLLGKEPNRVSYRWDVLKYDSRDSSFSEIMPKHRVNTFHISHDERYVVFHQLRGIEVLGIYDTQTDSLRYLTGDLSPNAKTGLRMSMWPRFNHDATRIVFFSSNNNLGSNGMYTMRVNQPSEFRILAGASWSGTWSSDGSMVVYPKNLSNNANERLQVHTLDMNTLQEKRITFITHPTYDMFWTTLSPDGKKIAFASNSLYSNVSRSVGAQLFIVNIDGTDLKQVTVFDYMYDVNNPEWHPTEPKILFTVSWQGMAHAPFIYDLETKKIYSYFGPEVTEIINEPTFYSVNPPN